LHPYVYLLPLCPDKSGIKVALRSVSSNFGAICFLNRSFVLRSRNLEAGQ
jgi:hypothetical protein